MEAAECHVILQNALNHSGLLDKLNHYQRNRVSQVSRLTTIAQSDSHSVTLSHLCAENA